MARTRIVELTGPSAVIGTYMGARSRSRLMVSDRAEEKIPFAVVGSRAGVGVEEVRERFCTLGAWCCCCSAPGGLSRLTNNSLDGRLYVPHRTAHKHRGMIQNNPIVRLDVRWFFLRSACAGNLPIIRIGPCQVHWTKYWARPQKPLLYTKYTVRIRITVFLYFFRGVVHFTRVGVTGWCGDTDNDTTPKGGDF